MTGKDEKQQKEENLRRRESSKAMTLAVDISFLKY
jgi:hypothetical protein